MHVRRFHQKRIIALKGDEMQVRSQNLIMLCTRTVIRDRYDRDSRIPFEFPEQGFTDQRGTTEDRIYVSDEAKIRVMVDEVKDFQQVL